MHSHIGSLNYDPTGRKRKSPGLKTVRKVKPKFKEYTPQPTYAQQRIDSFNTKYPSASLDSKTITTAKDESWKREASKNFTVAPAYNKGAYQVISNNNIKHIGK